MTPRTLAPWAERIVARVCDAAGADSLDVAWAEAEAALPPGATLSVSRTAFVQSGKYVAVADSGEPALGYAYADTPAQALRALAQALRDAAREPLA